MLFAALGAGALVALDPHGWARAERRWRASSSALCRSRGRDLFLAPMRVTWAAAAIHLLVGLSFSVWTAAAQSIVQLAVPDRLRGRDLEPAAALAAPVWTPLGGLITGALAEVGGTELAYAVAALVGIVVTLGRRRLARPLPAARRPADGRRRVSPTRRARAGRRARGRAGSRAGRRDPPRASRGRASSPTARAPRGPRAPAGAPRARGTRSRRGAAAADARPVEHRLPVDELRRARLAEPRAAFGELALELEQVAPERALEPAERGLDAVGRVPERGLRAAGRRRLRVAARPALEQPAERERRDLDGDELRDQPPRGRPRPGVRGDRLRPRRAACSVELKPRPPREGSSAAGACGRRRAVRFRRGCAPGAA